LLAIIPLFDLKSIKLDPKTRSLELFQITETVA